MNKSLALVPVMFAILALMVSPAIMDISATKDDNNGQHNGEPQNCDNGKGQDNVQNPNCEDGGGTGEGVDCTYSDGNITATELSSAVVISLGLAQIIIDTAEINAHTSTPNGEIDRDQELKHLNNDLDFRGLDTCY